MSKFGARGEHATALALRTWLGWRMIVQREPVSWELLTGQASDGRGGSGDRPAVLLPTFDPTAVESFAVEWQLFDQARSVQDAPPKS